MAKDRVDRMIRLIHSRIEQKFRDYRLAFIGFDHNSDKSLSFKEFMSGLETLGIRFKLEDYRLIFNHLDHD